MTGAEKGDHAEWLLAASRMATIVSHMGFPDNEDERRRFIDKWFARAAGRTIDRDLEEESISRAMSHDVDKDAYQPFDRRLVEMARLDPGHEALWREFSKLREIPSPKNSGAEKRGEPKRIVTDSHIVAYTVLIPMFANIIYETNHIGIHTSFRIILGIENKIDLDEKDDKRNTKENYDKGDPKGKRTLQSIWSHYRDVAHLWAAAYLLRWKTDLSSVEGIGIYLSVAESILSWGAQYKPFRAKEPLLDAATAVRMPDEWTVPVSLALDTFELPDEYTDGLYHELNTMLFSKALVSKR